MYNKILVPLDGSPLAEKALPLAVELANLLKASLLLTRVVKVPANISDYQAHEQELIRDAEFYLDEVRQFLTNPALKGHVTAEQIQITVAYGDPKEQILEIATAKKANLIIMTTHGLSIERRLTLGSVATQVLHHSDIPIILIKPLDVDKHTTLGEIMHQHPGLSVKEETPSLIVTLDGSPDEEILIAQQLNLQNKVARLFS